MNNILIATGPQPDEQIVFAANELKRYVSKLFGVTAVISPDVKPTETVVFLDAASAGLPRPSDEQTFLLRRFTHHGRPALAAVGGSPCATMWAVYDLVERWGVRYLLHGDIFPEHAGEFHLPEVDACMTPNLRVRCLGRLINDFACGPESWGLEENVRFINQLAKMKFNEIYLELWPYQSHIHYEFRGVQKRTGLSWYGSRYPIDGDTVGREIFGGATEFENPDLAGISDYEARHVAAREQAREILQHARRRGMKTGVAASIFEYPLEFQSVLPGSQGVEQLGHLSCGPSSNQDPDDPLLHELVRTVIRSHVQTYPVIDYLYLRVPEHRAWMDRAEDAWQRLDAKFDISSVMSLEDAVRKVRKRTQVVGGVERHLTRVKADVVALSLLDSVLADAELLARPSRPPIRVIYSFLAEELMPIVPKLLPPGGGLMVFVDYTARRVVDQIEVLDDVPADQVPCRMIFTLADDNIGPLPQLATNSLHLLASRIRANGWQGFTPRYWLIGDLDPTVQYLAHSSWDANVSPSVAYADLAAAICGAQGAEPLAQAWNLVGEVTDAFSDHGIGFGFPTSRMMMKQWEGTEVNPIIGDCLSDAILEDRDQYERAWQLAQEAAKHTRAAGKEFVAYLAGRLLFAIRYIETTEAVLKAGRAERSGQRKTAIAELQKALATIREAIQSYADVAADNSDRGAVALLNEYCYRRIRDKLKELTETN